MDLHDLIGLLDKARSQNGEHLVARTPHGTYTFEVADVEIGLNTGNVVLRLAPVEES